MRFFATFAVLLFSVQATLCGLRGFGIVELLHAQQTETSVYLASAEPARDSVPNHCAGRADGSAPLEQSQAPGEAPCRSHCQLYAQGIPSDAPHTLSVPVPVAVHRAAAQCELGIHPARALHLLTGFRAPPLARDLPILHATLLI
jgi:hypothetical protein